MTRNICDLVNEYPKGVDGPSYPIKADELKILDSRYDCYDKELGQPKDRLYCENATDSYKTFMSCLKTNKVEIYPDDIINGY
jgi:hypothetical protein